jgi:hypothetical protein
MENIPSKKHSIENKLTIIAPNIKNGGGKELLEYLLEYVEKVCCDIYVVAYLDISFTHVKQTSKRKVFFLGTTLEKVALFYKKFNNVIYFGNLPPLRHSSNSIVYIHNPYLLIDRREILTTSIKFYLKYSLQQWYIRHYIANVDSVACQNDNVKDMFSRKYRYNNIEVLPFFRVCNTLLFLKNEYDFCYVSLAHAHKNHNFLLDALMILSKKKCCLKIALTVEKSKIDLIRKIENINNSGYIKIDNLGVISKAEVCQLYARTKCLIFPSLRETFGLGLIEASEMGLDIIAPDLDYVHQVVRPSLTFDPDSSLSCANAIKMYIAFNDIRRSESLVENQIDVLINKFRIEKNV